MNRLSILALAGAIACAALFSPTPGRSSSLYPIFLTMKGEGATVSVYSPTLAAIRITVYVPANATKSYAMENAPVYEFRTTSCGKTHVARWTRVGAGVNASLSCTGFSFTQR